MVGGATPSVRSFWNVRDGGYKVHSQKLCLDQVLEAIFTLDGKFWIRVSVIKLSVIIFVVRTYQLFQHAGIPIFFSHKFKNTSRHQTTHRFNLV